MNHYGLPVPTDQLVMAVPPPFTAQTSPPYPQLNTIPELMQLQPGIAAELANQVVAGLNERKPTRVFLYNLVFQNQMNNPVWQELYVVTLDSLGVAIKSGAVRNVNTEAQAMITQIIANLIGHLVVSFPVLAQGNQPLMNEASGRNDRYNRLRQEAQNFRNSIQYGGGMQMSNPQQMTLMPQQQPAPTIMINPNGGYGSGFPTAAPPARQSFYSTEPAAAPVASGALTRTMVPPPQAAAPAAPAPTAMPDVVDKWFSSQEEPYPPMLTRDQVAVLQRPRPDAPYFIHVIYAQPMDRSEHTLPMPSNTIATYIPPAYSARAEARTDALETIGTAQTPDGRERVASVLEYYLELGDEEIVSDSVESAVDTARVFHKRRAGVNTTGSAFRVNMNVCKKFPATKSYDKELEPLVQPKNFQAVANLMKAYLVGAYDQEFKEMIFKLDLWLTRELNLYLKNDMGIDVTIGSFTEDAGDLVAYLRDHERFGEFYARPLEQHQTVFIRTLLGFSPSFDVNIAVRNTADGNNGGIGEAQAQNSAQMHEVVISISMTVMEILAEELNLKFSEDQACYVTAQSHPDLHKYLSRIVTPVDDNLDTWHFLATMDDKIFKLHKGAVVENAFLISQYKK